MEPAYINLRGRGGGGFAFGCITGAIQSAADGNAVSSPGTATTKRDEACGDGWAELPPDGFIIGQNCCDRGAEANFTARRWKTSSTHC
jgi:hypothetical protein